MYRTYILVSNWDPCPPKVLDVWIRVYSSDNIELIVSLILAIVCHIPQYSDGSLFLAVSTLLTAVFV